MARDRAALAVDVVDMRRRMLAGHPNPTAQFDLKHDPGGMVDVEFSVQYLVLAHAHDHDALTRNVGNIALLGIAADLGLVPAPSRQRRRRRLSRLSSPAAPDPADRRPARARRRRGAGRAPRRRDRAVDPRFRRTLAVTTIRIG